jgi:hypothetical protein
LLGLNVMTRQARLPIPLTKDFRDVFGRDLRSVLSVLLIMTAITFGLVAGMAPTSVRWCTLAVVFAQLFFLFFVLGSMVGW